MLNEFRDAAGESEFGGLFAALVIESDFQALVEKSVFAEASGQRVVAEDGLFENAWVGMELDFCAGFAGFASLLEFIGRLPFFVTLLPNGTIALNFEFEKVGESVDDGDTDAVETAGNFVRVAVEFSAGVKHGQDDFSRGALFSGVHVNGNRDGIVGVNGDVHFVRVAGHCFVDGVVDNFPDQVVKTHFAGRANVHGGAQTNGFQAAENFDGFRVVLMSAFYNRCFFIAHLLS